MLAKASIQFPCALIVAGRSSFVDDGIHVCAVDVASGTVRYRTKIHGPDVNDDSIEKSAGRMPGSLAQASSPPW